MKIISQKIILATGVLLTVIGVGLMIAEPVFADEAENCTNVLSSSWCNKDNKGGGIKEMVMLVVNILTAGLVVAATAGIVWCGAQIITARDDPAQVAKARKRMIEIIIGLVVWGLSAVLINLLLPGGDQTHKLGGVVITKIQL